MLYEVITNSPSKPYSCAARFPHLTARDADVAVKALLDTIAESSGTRLTVQELPTSLNYPGISTLNGTGGRLVV